MQLMANSVLAPNIQAHEPIYRLESELLKLPQVELPIQHEFCDGLYARTMHIPAGVCLTGAIHRRESFFVVRSGTLVVTTDDGVKQLNAGDMFVTKPGTKRAGVAMTEVVVTTFHANPLDETDPICLWDEFTLPEPARLLGGDVMEKVAV